jgi:hypothetical protein
LTVSLPSTSILLIVKVFWLNSILAASMKTLAIYRENGCSEKIGIFDAELIVGLPSSVKWIAHNGAGYDPVDVHACKAQGNAIMFS